MSVVDQRAWLATGAVRRSLLRAVLVLGGAFAVTVIGWLCCAGSANADVLPSVPSVPSVLSSVSSGVTAVTPKKLDTLSVPDVAPVARQAHHAVTEVGKRVVPSAAPAADLLPHNDLLPITGQVVPAAAQQAAKPTAVRKSAAPPATHKAERVSPAPSRQRQPFVVAVQHRHVPGSAALLSGPAGDTTSQDGFGQHSPVLPPLQPAGSSDSSVHGGSGAAGSSGGAQIPCTHLVGGGLIMADTSSTPRIAVGPGRQPGTSPD